MNKFFLLVLAFSIVTMGYGQSITDNLEGYYEFDGSGLDASGLSNDVVINGGASTTDRSNNPNSAILLNGVDEYVVLDTLLQNLQNTAYGTWSLWVKPNFQFPNEDFDTFVSFADKSANNSIQIDVRNDGKIKCFARTATQILWMIDSTDPVLTQNSWTHLVLVQDGTSPKLYVDGQLVSQSYSHLANSAAWFSSISNIDNGRVGDRSTKNEGEKFFFDGSIDDLIIFSRALNENEIAQLYDDSWLTNEMCSNIFCDGLNVGIGTQDTKGYRLAIAGKTITEEVKVALVQNWPDFVFEDNYEMLTLEEVERHINEKGHLPEIPSEAEVVENGINLGEMDAKLLQKIEELTLYMIQMNKDMTELKAKNKKLEEKVQSLENK